MATPQHAATTLDEMWAELAQTTRGLKGLSGYPAPHWKNAHDLYVAARAEVVQLLAPQPAPPVGVFWRWAAQLATVDPQSAAKLAAFNGYALHTGGGPYAMADVAWRDAPAGTPLVSVAQKSGDGTVAAVAAPVPAGTRHSGTNDRSLAIIDAAGVEYDFDACNDAITGAFGVAYALPGELLATHPGGGVNANASRFPYRACLVTPAEMAAGAIPHALNFVMPNVGGPTVYPASGSSEPGNGLPLGAWMRLDPAFDVSTLAIKWERTLATAMQRYGLFCRDIGDTFHICLTDQVNQGGNGPDWQAAGVPLGGSNNNGQPYIVGFSPAFPWSRLQVLLPPVKP